MAILKITILSIGISLGAVAAVMAQACCPTDSVFKHCDLQEVVVTEKLTDNNALLKFYKSHKTSATEDVLSRLAAVNLIRRGNYAMEPVIRGFSANQIGLTLDGIKIFGACTDHMDPPTSYVEPSNLKSIQLATNGASCKYGSNIGGSLNLQLAQAQLATENPLSGMFSSSYAMGTQSTNNVMELNYGAQNFGIRLSGVYRKANNYQAKNQEVPFTQFQKVNFSINGKYMLKYNSFLSLDVLMDDGWDIGYAALPMDVAFAKAKIYALSYKVYPKNSSFEYFEAKAYGNNINHSMDDTKRPLTPMHMDMPGTSNTYGAYAEALLNWNHKSRLTLRVDGYSNMSHAEMTMYPNGSTPMFMLTWPDVRNTNIGMFANNDYAINSKLTFSLNGRLDVNRASVTSDLGKQQLNVFNYDVDAPRVRLLKNIGMGLSYRKNGYYSVANFSYAERPASTNELYGFYLFNAYDGYDYIGNPTLKNEYALNAELSNGFKNAWADVNLTLFNSRVYNYTLGKYHPELSVMTIGANGTKIYEQVDYATLKGFELGLNATFAKHLNFIGNLRYTCANDYSGNPLPMISPLKLTGSLHYQQKQLSLQAESIWASAQNRVSTAVNEKSTPAYALFNARAGYNFLLKKQRFELNVALENIFDTYYREHLDWGNIPRPGRSLITGLSYLF